MRQYTIYTENEVKEIARPSIEEMWYEDHNDDSCDLLEDSFDDFFESWLDGQEEYHAAYFSKSQGKDEIYYIKED